MKSRSRRGAWARPSLLRFEKSRLATAGISLSHLRAPTAVRHDTLHWAEQRDQALAQRHGPGCPAGTPAGPSDVKGITRRFDALGNIKVHGCDIRNDINLRTDILNDIMFSTQAEVLRQARIPRSWSQREFSAWAGIPQAHISRIERGAVDPKLSTLQDLVRVLDA